MNAELKTSYRHCAKIARRAASSFYYSFYLLPREQRRSMFALYAFLRATDDLADEESSLDVRKTQLRQWRDALNGAIDRDPRGPIFPALADTLRRHELPSEHLFAVIDGCERDLDGTNFQTFSELEKYCHQVASAVGLACIYIWGFNDSAALAPATDCGVAFQLTNILRDLQEDLARERLYLPAEDLERFGYCREELAAGIVDDRFRALADFQIQRATIYYERARELPPYLSEGGRRAFGAMFDTYAELLAEVIRHRDDLLSQRISLSRWQKIQIAARWLRPHRAEDRHATEQR